MPSTGGGMQIELIALGDVQISRRLLRFGERAAEPIPLWNSIFTDLMMIERVQFLTEGGHGSGGWTRLADSTTLEKQRKGEEPWIERATEALFKSLTEPLAADQIHERTSQFLRFGTRRPYAGFQQTGTRNMPQRKLIDLKLSERRAIVKKVQRFIVTGEIAPL